MDKYPKYHQLPIRPDLPPGSAWGVFGDDDDVGTLNFSGAEQVRAAAQLVVSGRVFPLNWSLDLPNPPVLERRSIEHHIVSDDAGGTEDYYDRFYPQASSQWDALCHIAHPEWGYYNGVPKDETPVGGGQRLDITSWAERGIAGRFALADIAEWRARNGRPLDCAVSTPITTSEVETVLKDQGIVLEPGSILLLRFGWIDWYETTDEGTRQRLAEGIFESPGLACEEETVEWLWNKQVAAVAADCPAVEVMPFELNVEDRFLHYRLIPLLGFAVGELFDLRSLARFCHSEKRYEGLLTAAPLNKRMGGGSSANALALM